MIQIDSITTILQNSKFHKLFYEVSPYLTFIGLIISIIGIYLIIKKKYRLVRFKLKLIEYKKSYLKGELIEFIQKKIDIQLLDINGFKFPAYTILNIDDNISISDYIITEYKDISEINYKFIEYLRDIGETKFNLKCFRLITIFKSINDESLMSKNTIKLGYTDYFQCMSSCDINYYKLIRKKYFSSNPFMYFNRNLFFLKLNKTIDHIKKFDFSMISGAMGCSVLTVMKRKIKNDVDYIFWIVKSSSEKNALEEMHVVPSFMYQPISDNIDHPVVDLTKHILKEFAEEVLNCNEIPTTEILDEMIYNKKQNKEAIHHLNQLLTSKKAEIKITSLTLDILRLRPEITCILFIDDEVFYQKHKSSFTFNWEHKRGGVARYYTGIVQESVDLSLKKSHIDYKEEIFNPAGLACVKFGLEYLYESKKFFKKKV